MTQNRFVEEFNERELEILKLMADGLTNREIGEQLFIGVETVKWYAKHIYSKMGVSGRKAASIRAAELGLLDTEQQTEMQPKHNLPVQATAFIGRRNDLKKLATLLGQDATRIITLLAPGGMGKTRLALEIANRFVKEWRTIHLQGEKTFSDGVFFVPLQSLSNFEQMTSQIAASCDFQLAHNNREPKLQLLEHLANKQMLLIMDNCEHVIQGVSFLSEVGRVAPGVKIIATSREKLQLSGEIVYVLDGLQLPEWKTRQEALKSDAVKLLVQSARQVQPDWNVTSDNLEFVARICHLTRGMPLGIILAAGWLDVYSLERIVAEIQTNVDFLETKLRDIPKRQQSIRAVFEWTWERLKPAERDVFMKLSVFHNGCTPQAAETITGADRRILQSLVNRALLVRRNDGRYDFHELLRQYGEAQLVALPAINRTTRNAHAAYYSEVALGIWLGIVTGIDGEAALENLTGGWYWAIETHNIEMLWQSINYVWFAWYIFGRFAEGAIAFERALSMIDDSENSDYELLFCILSGYAFFSIYHQPTRYPEQTLTRAQTLLADIDITQARREIAAGYFYLPMAMRYFRPEQSLAIFRTFVDYWQAQDLEPRSLESLYLLYSIWNMANVYATILDQPESARPLAQQSLIMAQQMKHRFSIVLGKSMLGKIEYIAGNYTKSQDYIHEAITMSRGLNEKYNFASALSDAGSLATIQGEIDEARHYFVEALHLLSGYGLTTNTSSLLVGIAQWLAKIGDSRRAILLATFVLERAAHRYYSMDEAKELLKDLEATIPSSNYKAAVKQGQSLKLRAIFADLIVELEE